MDEHEALKAAARDALMNMAQAVGFSLFNVNDDADGVLMPWAFEDRAKKVVDALQALQDFSRAAEEKKTKALLESAQ